MKHRITFISKGPTTKYHPDKPLGYGTSDGWVWAWEQAKLLNRLSGIPRQKSHPDFRTLFSVAARTPLYLMEQARKELENRVIDEQEIPRSIEHQRDITTLYLQILWRKCVNHNEFYFPKVGWTKKIHFRKLQPIKYYETIGCDSSEEWELLNSMMTISEGTSVMHHGQGRSRTTYD